jgi:hypothetical protein
MQSSDLEYGIPNSEKLRLLFCSVKRPPKRTVHDAARTFLSWSHLIIGQICPKLIEAGWQMDKRDRFVAEIGELAREQSQLPGRLPKGKGGHAMVYVGDKLTTLPSREIDPKTTRKIKKHLGLLG